MKQVDIKMIYLFVEPMPKSSPSASSIHYLFIFGKQKRQGSSMGKRPSHAGLLLYLDRLLTSEVPLVDPTSGPFGRTQRVHHPKFLADHHSLKLVLVPSPPPKVGLYCPLPFNNYPCYLLPTTTAKIFGPLNLLRYAHSFLVFWQNRRWDTPPMCFPASIVMLPGRSGWFLIPYLLH